MSDKKTGNRIDKNIHESNTCDSCGREAGVISLCDACIKQIQTQMEAPFIMGKTIRYPVIGLTGKKQNGKSSFSDMLHKKIGKNVTSRINFKDPLLDLARQIGWNGEKDEKGRRFLQLLGTDCVRECIDYEYWVKRWTERAQMAIKINRIVISDDIRFDNEAVAVKNLGGIIVEVVTPSVNANTETDTHKSEAGITANLIDKTYSLQFGLDHIQAAVDDFYQTFLFMYKT